MSEFVCVPLARDGTHHRFYLPLILLCQGPSSLASKPATDNTRVTPPLYLEASANKSTTYMIPRQSSEHYN